MKYGKIKIILSIVIMLCAFVGKTSAQNKILLPTVTVDRGSVFNLEVEGTISLNGGDGLKLIIEYNSLLIDIRSVSGADTYAMTCDEPVLVKSFDDYEAARIEISCDQTQSVIDGIICSLEIEVLAGPDSVGRIAPMTLFINDAEASDCEYIEGAINIPGTPVIESYIEGIGQNYPNPFAVTTKFPFTMEKTDKPEFFIYSSTGRLSVSSKNNPDAFKVYLFMDNSVTFDLNDDNLDIGYYVMELCPDPIFIASGSYYLIMKTDKAVYFKSFLYMK